MTINDSDAKVIISFLLVSIISMVVWIFTDQRGDIEDITAAKVISEQTIINISHQLSGISANQKQLMKKTDELDKKVTVICNNQRQYWATHGCSVQ